MNCYFCSKLLSLDTIIPNEVYCNNCSIMINLLQDKINYISFKINSSYIFIQYFYLNDDLKSFWIITGPDGKISEGKGMLEDSNDLSKLKESIYIVLNF